MSVRSTLLDNDSITNPYPDIVYTLEPIIQHSTRLLRILRWKNGYTHQSIMATLLWTLFWFHSLIMSYTIPIWILVVTYYSFIDQQQPNMKETTVDAFEKLTVELKEIEFELSLILPSQELKDRFRQWCRSGSQFVLGQTFFHKSLLFISLYTTWISLLKLFGGDKITWFIGCIILTWNSPLLKVTRYSYHRATFMLKQYTNNNNNNKKVSEAQAFAMSNMTTTTTTNNKQKNNNDHFDRFYRFVVIEHQRWWLHCGWSSLLFPNERPEWSDEYLSKVPSIQSFHLPPPTTRLDKVNHKTIKISWEWISQDWEVDRNHSLVDKKGWEYGSFDWKLWSTKSSGLRVLTRRRRWVRNARLVEEVIEPTDDQRSIITTSTTMAIPIIMKKTNTCSSLSTSLSSEDSFMCSTPTITTIPTLFQSKSSPTTSTSTFSSNHHSVTPSIFSDHHSTVDSQLWLRR